MTVRAKLGIYLPLSMLFFGFSCSSLQANNFGFQVTPSTFDYNYLDVTSIITTAEGNGVGLKISADVEPNFAMTATVEHTLQSANSTTYLAVGTTYHQLLKKTDAPTLDWVIHLSLEARSVNNKLAEKDASAISHDIGLRIGSGLRYQIRPYLDLYSDIAVSTTTRSTVHIRIGASYDITTRLNLYSSYEFSDTDKFRLGFRRLF